MANRRNNKPASGIPASGAGWGGPAKGAGKSNRAPKFTSENAAEMGARRHAPEALARMADRIASADELKRVLTAIALEGESETNRMNAAEKLLNRIEGMPVAKQQLEIREIDKLTDAELDAAIASLRAGSPEDPDGGEGEEGG